MQNFLSFAWIVAGRARPRRLRRAVCARDRSEKERERFVYLFDFVFLFSFLFLKLVPHRTPPPAGLEGGMASESLCLPSMGPVPWLGPDMGSGAMAFAALAVGFCEVRGCLGYLERKTTAQWTCNSHVTIE
jgi:hypothetical protein